MKKITPFLWFDTQAEEAMNFYVSLFPDGAVTSITCSGGLSGTRTVLPAGDEASMLMGLARVSAQGRTKLRRSATSCRP